MDLLPSSLPLTGFVLPAKEKCLERSGQASVRMSGPVPAPSMVLAEGLVVCSVLPAHCQPPGPFSSPLIPLTAFELSGALP